METFEFPDVSVAAFYDKKTGSWQYVVRDRQSNAAAVIDPVWNYDEKAGAVSTDSADDILRYVEKRGLEVKWVLDTHPHADHFSAAPYIASKYGAQTAIGDKVPEVQRIWCEIYGLDDVACDGSQWDRLFGAGDTFRIGGVEGRVLFSPGHTLASITYVFGSCAFVHDTLMVPDSGTSRADFPGGDARALWRSIREILDLPDQTTLFVGHDYGKDERAPACQATVVEHRDANIHVRNGIDEEEFIRRRNERDETLPLPDLMLAALQVNIRGGHLPDPDHRGRRFLRIPLGQFEPKEAD